MARPIIGIEVYKISTYLHQRFVIALVIIDATFDGGATCVSEIKLSHARQLRQRLRPSATPGKVPAELFLTAHIVRIKLKRVPKFFLRRGKIPLVPPIQPAKRTMGLAETRIQFQSFIQGFAGMRRGLLWKHPSLRTQVHVAICQAHIGQCEVRVLLNGLSEKRLGFSKTFLRTSPPAEVRTPL